MSIYGDDKPISIIEPSAKQKKIISALKDYKKEADDNRKGGLNPRDDKWRQNLDLYWNRYDFSGKAEWQSKNVMPEVPGYVDRFAAALKDTMVNTPNGFYTVTNPYDTENDLSTAIKSMSDVWLSTSGKNQLGQTMDFSTVFEEQVKMGALMAMSATVGWKDDVKGGRVAIESVDPRFVWLDHTYRNLYRIRRTEVDMIDVARLANAKSSKGNSIYDLNEISRLVSAVSAEQGDKRDLSGHGEDSSSDRKPIVLDEYIASVVDENGKIIMDEEVVVMANDEYLIRGPEKNPFWHKKDWLVYTPLMPVPLSPYGRTYMEDFGSMAKVFNDLTNLLLDAVYMSAMNAYAVVPAMLTDPNQLNGGIYPNKTFMLEEGYNAEDFLKAIKLGTLDSGAVQIWQNIKSELSDAAGMNEISMGQLPDKTHIAAAAVSGAQQSASSVLRSVAQTIETRWLDPVLDLNWKTGLQHAMPNDPRMSAAVGDGMYAALIQRRKELIVQPITFQARGISALLQKQQKLTALMGVMQLIAQDPTKQMMNAFMAMVDVNKFLQLIFSLSNVDITKMELSAREKLVKSVTEPMGAAGMDPGAQAGGAGQPSPPALKMMGDVTQGLGIGK